MRLGLDVHVPNNTYGGYVLLSLFFSALRHIAKRTEKKNREKCSPRENSDEAQFLSVLLPQYTKTKTRKKIYQ